MCELVWPTIKPTNQLDDLPVSESIIEMMPTRHWSNIGPTLD